MNIFTAFIIEVSHVDFVLTLNEGLSLFPIMHSINKHSFEFINCMIEPQDVSKIVLIDSAKVDFVIKIVCSFEDI